MRKQGDGQAHQRRDQRHRRVLPRAYLAAPMFGDNQVVGAPNRPEGRTDRVARTVARGAGGRHPRAADYAVQEQGRDYRLSERDCERCHPRNRRSDEEAAIVNGELLDEGARTCWLRNATRCSRICRSCPSRHLMCISPSVWMC